MTTINQREYNTINLKKSCQRGSFKLETAREFEACDYGGVIPVGTLVKLFRPRNTFATGLTVDGRKFIARAEWLCDRRVA